MPILPIPLGKMNVESDATSTKDGELAHIINAYRIGKSFHMWPGLTSLCDLGTGEPVYSYYSTLHNKHLAVSAARLFDVDANGVAVEVSGTSLTRGVPPSFAENAESIFIAADSVINKFIVASNTISLPRGDIDPVVSAELVITTATPEFTLTHFAVESTTGSGCVLRYSVVDVNDSHFKVEYSLDNGTTWREYSNDEAPGENKTVTITGSIHITRNVKLRLTQLTGDERQIVTPSLVVYVAANLAPTFSTQPTAGSITGTSLVMSYGTADNESNTYKLSYSLDNGLTWTVKNAVEAPGTSQTATIGDLDPGTDYRILLRLTGNAGNATNIDSQVVSVRTSSNSTNDAANNDADSPLTFSSSPAASEITTTGAKITYSTADNSGYHYQLEYSLDGGESWTVEALDEAPGSDQSFTVEGLTAARNYPLKLRLTSRSNQAPSHVTSLGYVSGFLIADGNDPEGGLPGDFGYSDDEEHTQWSYENNATKPDALQALVTTANREVFAIGVESVDVSYVSTDVTNPFAAQTTASVNYGTPARYSVAYDQQSIYFLTSIGGNRQIVRLVGGRDPQIISFPISVPIADIRDVSTARAGLVGFQGQTFYVISFPDADVTIDDMVFPSLTLAFHIRNEEWSIVGEWFDQRSEYDRWKGESFAFNGSTLYIGGTDGKIYTLGEPERETEPKLTHRWRNDGRKEWGISRVLSLGTIGNRVTPLKSRLCGRYYKRQDEFVVSDGPYRMSIRTGWRNWGKNAWKICSQYVYDLKRGDAGIVLNGIEEDITVTR